MNRVDDVRVFQQPLNRERISKISLLISTTIIYFAALLLLIVTAGFAMGIGISKWSFIIALFAVLGIEYFMAGKYSRGKRWQVFLLISFLFFVILFLCFLIGNYFYDLSWDGQTYHQDSIIQLYHGWNPFYQKIPANVPYRIWIEHYPKALEIMAAALYKLSRSIEAGKAFNLLFIIAAFFIALSLLLKLKKTHPVIAVFTALIIALNPVSICQTFSFYIDGLLGSVIASFIVVGILIYRKPDRFLYGAFLALLVILINLKFTAVIYAMLFICGLMIALWISKKMETLKRVCIAAGVGFCLGIFLIGFNPYLTNTIGHQHPFYPIFGPHKIDIGVNGNTPVYFLKMNRLQSLVCSILAQAENELPGQTLKLKIPFTIAKETYWFACADVRTGGFGPLFSGAVTLSFILLIGYLSLLIRRRDSDKLKFIFYIMMFLLISVLINPVTWWARYNPQLWLVPICMIPLWAGPGFPVLRIGKYLLIGVLLYNIYIVGSVNFLANLHNTQALRNQLQRIAAQNKIVDVYFGPFDSNRVRFEKMGIQYHEYKDEKELESKEKTTTIIWPNVKVGSQ